MPRTPPHDAWSTAGHSRTIRVSGATATRHGAGSNSRTVVGTAMYSSGVAIWDVVGSGGHMIIGLCQGGVPLEKWLGATTGGWGVDTSDGQKSHQSWAAFTNRIEVGARIRVIADMTTHKFTLCVNNVSRGVVFGGVTGTLRLAASLKLGGSVKIIAHGHGRNMDVAVRSVTRVTSGPVAAPAASGIGDVFHRASSLITVTGNVARRTRPGSNSRTAIGNMGVTYGTARWTIKPTGGTCIVGVACADVDLEKWVGATGVGWGYDGSDGQKSHGGQWAGYARRFRPGDVVTVKVDMNRHTVAFEVNGADQGVAYRDVRGTVHVAVSLGVNCSAEIVRFIASGGGMLDPRGGPRPTPVQQAAAPPPGTENEEWSSVRCSRLLEVDNGGRTVRRPAAATGSNSRTVTGSIRVTSGVAMWRVRAHTKCIIGVATKDINCESYLGQSKQTGWGYDGGDGQFAHGGWSAFSSPFVADDEVTVKVDMDAGTLEYSINGGTWYVAARDLRGKAVYLAVSLGISARATILGFRRLAAGAHASASAPTPAAAAPAAAPAAVPAAVPLAAAEPIAALAGRAQVRTTIPVHERPLEFDAAWSYSGINVTGATATLASGDQGDSRTARSQRGFQAGRNAWTVQVLSPGVIVGVASDHCPSDTYLGSSGGYGYDGSDGQVAHKGAWQYFGAGFRKNDRVTVVLDCDMGTLEFIVNGASQGIAGRGIESGKTYFPAVSLAQLGSSARLLEAAAPLPPPTVTPARRRSSVSPAETAAAAVEQLLAANIESEYTEALRRLNVIASATPQFLVWKDLVTAVSAKRKSPSFHEVQWTTAVAKSYGTLLRTLKTSQG